MELINEKFAASLAVRVRDKRMYDFYGYIQPYMRALRGIVARNGHVRHDIKYAEIDCSFEDMKDLALAFFKEFNEEMYHNIDSILKDANLRYSEPQEANRGALNSVGGDGKTLNIDLNPTNDVEGLCVVAHEFSHVGSERNVKKVREKEQLLGEIESKFIEKVYSKWLCENGVINKVEYNKKAEAQLRSLVVDCEMAVEESELLAALNNDFSVDNLRKVFNGARDRRRTEEVLTRLAYGKDGNDDFWGKYVSRYIVGEIVAQVLFEEYQQTPADTEQRFAEFMRKNAELGFEEGIKLLLGENYIEKVNRTFFPNAERED